MAKKENKIEELLERPENLIEDIQNGKWEIWYEQYKNIITYVGGGILGVVLLIVGWKYYTTSQNEEGQAAMFQAVYYFESDSLSKALNGDGNNLGFVDIAADFQFTKAGNLANFYAGAALLKQGKFEESIDYLKSFSSSDILVQARAYSLIGDAYMEQDDFDNAASYYKKAADWKSTKEFTPDYLMKLGLAYELNKDFSAASKAYQRIIDEFPNSQKLNEAKKYKGMNDAMAESN
ncbi:MAG: tetratricopeptide repeat protein [Cytophagales bacterium]